jgi:hypothetical protein
MISYIFWSFKRFIWQILLAVSLIAAFFIASTLVQSIIAGSLLFRISLDLWNYFGFKSYSLVNNKAQRKTWQNILQEFTDKNGQRTAFFRITRENVRQQIEQIMREGSIQQTNNNLCGPIAFLNFLLTHDPALFVKTLCEYAENGCTYAPFYLQSSLWDRYAYFFPIGIINNLFSNHFASFGQALAAGFKNTHNLLGYNNTCLIETFKGSTEPKKISEWLAQAGFQSSSHTTLNNFKNNKEMPWLARFILGGVYADNNRENPINCNPDRPVCHINLTQNAGNTPLHFLFNVASGHWTFSDTQEGTNNCIQIPLINRRRRS